MVYAMSYEPTHGSFPMAEVAEGNAGEVELEDMTPDGGVGLNVSRSFSGRRVVPNSVPKKIRWCSRRKLQDYETSLRKTVSARFRILIEDIEPGVHQFIPVEFVAEDGMHLEQRWFWQVCNRLDSVHREKSNFHLGPKGAAWMASKTEEPRLVFDLSRVGTIKFWHDKHKSNELYITDDTKERIESADLTGLRYHHYEQA